MKEGRIVADGSPRDIFHDLALVRTAIVGNPFISPSLVNDGGIHC